MDKLRSAPQKKLSWFLLVIVSFAFVSIFLPESSEAAGNDVSLTQDTTILVNGITVNVTGQSAALQSITVNDDNATFTVVLGPNSSIAISAPGLNELSATASGDVADETSSAVCNSATSSLSLSYSGASTVTNVITPSVTLCQTTSSTNLSAPTPPTIGGGGGFVIGSPAYNAWLAQYVPKTTVVSTTTEAHPDVLSLSTDLTTGDTGAEVASLQTWLIAHGYDIPSISSGKIPEGVFGAQTKLAVQAFQKAHDIPATGTIGPITRSAFNQSSMSITPIVNQATSNGTFARDLSLGMKGPDVHTLQVDLNHDPATQLVAIGPGSPGNETDYFGTLLLEAVKKFQVKYGIAGPGNQGYGRVGPATRAKLNAIYGI